MHYMRHCRWKFFSITLCEFSIQICIETMNGYFHTVSTPFFCVLSFEYAAKTEGLKGWWVISEISATRLLLFIFEVLSNAKSWIVCNSFPVRRENTKHSPVEDARNTTEAVIVAARNIASGLPELYNCKTEPKMKNYCLQPNCNAPCPLVVWFL